MKKTYKTGLNLVVGGGTVFSAAIFLAPSVFAQQSGGTLKTVTIVSSLRADDNYDLDPNSAGNALIFDNTLEFGLISETEIDSFEGSVSGTLRAASLPVLGEDLSLDDGTVDLDYSRAIDDNSLKLGFFFNDADVEFLDPLRTLDDDGAFDDILGEGRRRLINADFGVLLNSDGPVSLELTGRMRDRDYRDTTDPELLDRLDLNGDVELGFTVAPDYTVIVGAGYRSSVEEDDALDREQYTVETGLVANVTPTRRIEGRIGYSFVESIRDGEDDKQEEGAVGSLEITEALRNGEISFGGSSRLNENGQRNSVFLGRVMELPSGSIDANVGLSNSNATDIRPFANISYLIERPTSSFEFNMRQNFTVDDDGNDVVNAAFGASYIRQVTPLSSWGFDASAGRQTQLDEFSTSNGTTRLTVTASYNHTLTDSWGLSTGLTHRTRIEEDSSDAQSNAVFLNLTKQFSAK